VTVLAEISHIFFDLDDTLLATRQAVLDGVRSAATAMEEAGAKLSAREIEKLMIDRVIPAVSSLNRYELFEAVAFELGMRDNDIALRGLSAYSAAIDIIPPFPETLPTLERLQSAGKILSVVSNGSLERQNYKLWGAKLAPYFQERVFLPQSINPPFFKPNTTLFRHAMAKTDARPQNSLMVGDRDMDMIGAKLTGMTTVGMIKVNRGQFDPAGDGCIKAGQPDFIIDNLSEIIPLLGLEPH
jgi:FMN phosphatase YigB (HAD superfamily)